MSKKAPPKDVPHPLGLDLNQIKKENSVNNLDFFNHSNQFANDNVDAILQKGAEIMYEKYVAPKIQPYQVARRYKELTEICHQKNYPGDFGEIDPKAKLAYDKENKMRVVNRAFPINAWIEGDEPVAFPIDRHIPKSLKVNLKEVIKTEIGDNLSETSKTSKSSISRLSKMKTMMRRKTRLFKEDRKNSEDSQLLLGKASYEGSMPTSGDITNVKNSLESKLLSYMTKEGHAIPQYPLESDRVKNKYIDFSPRAKEVEQLREKKEVEFRNKARINAEINRRVKMEKLKS